MLRLATTVRCTLVLAAVLLAAAPSSAQFGFGWTISASSTEPFVNTATFVSGVTEYFLWFNCTALPQANPGLAAAEFGLVASSPNVILGFLPLNGFLNLGSGTDLLLAVGGCPFGPVLAGRILVFNAAPGSYCLGPTQSGRKIGVDCEEAEDRALLWTGLDTGGGPCEKGSQGGRCDVIDCICFYCTGSGCANFIGPCGCDGKEICATCPTPVSETTWGRTKGRYR